MFISPKQIIQNHSLQFKLKQFLRISKERNNNISDNLRLWSGVHSFVRAVCNIS